ncbi:SIR2-domain-containing protein [Piedraia hortae CBS 480.64]|uniref:SIR2-domain-containing protein n=1 Tax=Piedraia hortae CBS 480.64 TaxID=1314780 RepID=A0A6A7C824_9PEZI|nr:SIR2-domain-containing protein [Piedraia hortae CBS 480.64]
MAQHEDAESRPLDGHSLGGDDVESIDPVAFPSGSNGKRKRGETVCGPSTAKSKMKLELPEEEGTQDEESDYISELRSVGIQDFLKRHLWNLNELAQAFGLDPTTVDPGRLISAVRRAFYSRTKLPQYNTLDDAVSLLKSSHKILVITGAGISTSLGIPDFRSPGTGFYDRLQSMGMLEPEDVFDIETFDSDPSIFYRLASLLLPDQNRFTPTHSFLKLLQDQSRLLTNYTQNIDNLERLAGVSPACVVQCHGSFATATCRRCKQQVPGETIFPDIRAGKVSLCTQCPAPARKKRSQNDDDDSDEDVGPGVMKPDITFFGEKLSDSFFARFESGDVHDADLVLAIGTSLQVAPVSEMPGRMKPGIPHIYISREPVRHIDFDIQLLGDCDDIVQELAVRAGWREGQLTGKWEFAVDGESHVHRLRIV